jgi:formylglycine-generating enzyme required for sulfatase activity
MSLVRVSPGEFLMGSDAQHDVVQPVGPRHRVKISREFWIGKFEVTQSEYRQIMQASPSRFCAGCDCADAVEGINTSRFPVDHVTWEEAVEFCRRLSALPEEKLAGRSYRLPTEAEWEYACRAGSDGEFSFGENLDTSCANIGAPSNGGLPLERPAEVGSYPPNAWGLHDTHGNVWEWCGDGRREYSTATVSDPRGGNTLTPMLRGGAWDFPADYARSAHRQEALRGYVFFGFRVVCTMDVDASHANH